MRPQEGLGVASGTGARDLAVAARQGTREFCTRGTPSPPFPFGPLPPTFLAVRLGLLGREGRTLVSLGQAGVGGSWLVHAQRRSS